MTLFDRQHRALAPFEDPEDIRTETEKDYNRILYSSAFLRLGGVSQVAHTSEASVLHNRLTHSLKVASLSRSLAERLIRLCPDTAKSAGGLDPSAAAAGALAHDLGHPPFGHVCECELDRIATNSPDHEDDFPKKFGPALSDGFEGNAQSFRIVTRLAALRDFHDGLNLTRATLRAVLKYPWLRGSSGKQSVKWGCYNEDEGALGFARAPVPNARSLEAQVMDFCDDVAYTTHDLTDFYKAGLIPLDRFISNDPEEIQHCIKKTSDRRRLALTRQGRSPSDIDKTVKVEMRALTMGFEQLHGILSFYQVAFRKPYEGTRQQRIALRMMSSDLERRAFSEARLEKPRKLADDWLRFPEQVKNTLFTLKQILWTYVITGPALAAQQEGAKRLIRDLFRILYTKVLDTKNGCFDLFTPLFRETAATVMAEHHGDDRDRAMKRLVLDYISDMTELQCYRLYAQYTGHAPDSTFDAVTR